jgi:hypothetical protein
MTSSQHLYEVRPRKNRPLISALVLQPFIACVAAAPLPNTASGQQSLERTPPRPSSSIHNQPPRFIVWRLFVFPRSSLFEIARVFVRRAVKLGVADVLRYVSSL